MVSFHETIPDSSISWILTQKIFWVATAPLSGSGHVNVSPKSGDHFFGLIDNKRYWAQKSQLSMDGLPAMKRAVEYARRENIAPRTKMVGPLAPKNRSSRGSSPAMRTLALVFISFVFGMLVEVYSGLFGSVVSNVIAIRNFL
ncbi:hypothetical protein GGR51DRAFT_526694 [Nemania sp. FL0031]|nr:hypothetical protein GGR51DRAFT_526694 [Nemania sp. FL0031]